MKERSHDAGMHIISGRVGWCASNPGLALETATVKWSWSRVEFATDGQSASMSWCRAALWGPWPDFTCSLVWHVLPSSCRAPSLTRRRFCILLQFTPLTGWSQAPVTIYCSLIRSLERCWSGVEFATDGQSASMSRSRAALWSSWPDFTSYLSDERTGL
jgi:hypothetical protein